MTLQTQDIVAVISLLVMCVPGLWFLMRRIQRRSQTRRRTAQTRSSLIPCYHGEEHSPYGPGHFGLTITWPQRNESSATASHNISMPPCNLPGGGEPGFVCFAVSLTALPNQNYSTIDLSPVPRDRKFKVQAAIDTRNGPRQFHRTAYPEFSGGAVTFTRHDASFYAGSHV